MFHNAVCQHMQGLVGFLNNQFTVNLPRNLCEKIFVNRLRFGRIMARVCGRTFLAHPVHLSLVPAVVNNIVQNTIVIMKCDICGNFLANPIQQSRPVFLSPNPGTGDTIPGFRD